MPAARAAALVQLAEADDSGHRPRWHGGSDCGLSKALRDEITATLCGCPRLVRAKSYQRSVNPRYRCKPDDGGRWSAVEDYGHVGLSLRRHPVSFLRQELRGTPHRDLRRCRRKRAMVSRLEAAGLCPSSSAPGGGADGASCSSPLRTKQASQTLVVWPKVFETFRRVVASAGMLAVRGRIQREEKLSTSSRSS